MSLLVGEAAAYRLVPFVRQWASSDARWDEIMSMFFTLDKTCSLVVTTWHWTSFAILCSVITRAKFQHDEDSGTVASLWCSPKPYPASVITMVSELPLPEAQALQTGFQHTVSLLHTWCWVPSDALDEEVLIMLSSLKAAARYMYLLVRAAIVAKQNRGLDHSEPSELEV